MKDILSKLKEFTSDKQKVKKGILVGVLLIGVLVLVFFPNKKDDKSSVKQNLIVGTNTEAVSHSNLPIDTNTPSVLRANLIYALNLVYTYTPQTARENFSEFMANYVVDEQKNELEDILNNRLMSIIDNNHAQFMELDALDVLPTGYQALLKTRLIKYDFRDTKIKIINNFYLNIDYRYFNGNLEILAINTISENAYMRLIESLQY